MQKEKIGRIEFLLFYENSLPANPQVKKKFVR